jgi:gluconate 5-dehydrogenase
VNHLFNLEGRVALVTGASQGLGRVMAETFAAVGALVLVNSRSAERCRNVVDAIRAQGGRAEVLAFDVADRQGVAAAMAAIDGEHGRLDILVNNVGIRLRQGVETIDLDEFNHLFQVDVLAAFDLSRRAAALMGRNRWGRIIMMSSMAGQIAGRGNLPYATAKGGMDGMTRALAAEYGQFGITCNALAPGGFATEYNLPTLTPENRARIAARTPLGRVGEPGEIAGPALFLASEAASYVTGVTLNVDGGTVNYF